MARSRRLSSLIAGSGLVLAPLRPVAAQDTLPPHLGGYVASLGLPQISRPYVGIGMGLWSDAGTRDLTTELRVGVFRDLVNPVTGLLGASLEAYGGFRNVEPSGGLRATLASHVLGLGAGVDFDVGTGDFDALVRLTAPVRRGGIIGGGSDLTLEWFPTRRESFNLAVNIPIAQRNRGTTRPLRDHVRLRPDRPEPVDFVPRDSRLRETLEQLRDASLWVNRLSMPSLGHSGGNAADAAAAAARVLKQRLAGATPLLPPGHSANDEIRVYHLALNRAFSLVLSGDTASRGDVTVTGDAVAARARQVLLERVIFPYNRLVGQRKKKDTTREFGGHARGVFVRWLVVESAVPADKVEPVLYVFQYLLDLVEEVRAENHRVWGDDRLVWLPLQLALTPEQYDGQEELDTLLSRAVGRSVTHGNTVWYIHNDRFHLELERQIAAAEEYHVLWIHDFRGFTDEGNPDRLALLRVTRAYLDALRRRVEDYDSTGRVPVYMIFLDQYYFEVRHSRPLLRFLEDPLGRQLRLPRGFESLERQVAESQRELREAVAASRLLQAEKAQYGERWLRDLVSVHVNITNPADPSFRSNQVLPLLGMPDDVMRDHRKLSLYDVSEDDPFRGMAMYAGMGVGEVYAGGGWEDRAVRLQGPAALSLRDEVLELMATQGIPPERIPHVLRPRPKARDYQARVDSEIKAQDDKGLVATRAIELHNGTGFAPKELVVAKATLFNLASPGSVLKTPDSLWLNHFLAGLLAGAALRGCRVLMIAPSLESAPQQSWGPMVLAHDLLSRALAMGLELAPQLARSGGLLRVGLYDPGAGVNDLGYRIVALHRALARYDFLRKLYDFDPSMTRLLDSLDASLSPGLASSGDSGGAVHPKLHFKGFLYISGSAWSALISGPPMAGGFRQYVVERFKQLRGGVEVGETEMAVAMQDVGAAEINPILEKMSKDQKAPWAFFLQVGSHNHNYRSMVMDGEAAVFVSNWTSLYAEPDFALLTGLVAWLDDQRELNRLLPVQGGLKWLLARWFWMGL